MGLSDTTNNILLFWAYLHWFFCVLAIIVSVLLALLTFVFIEKPFIKRGKFVIDYVARNKFKIVIC